MTHFIRRYALLCALLLFAALLPWLSPRARAQWSPGPQPFMQTPTTPSAQQNAMSTVRSRVTWLQNATRTAPNYATGAVGMVWQQFQFLRGSYQAFTMTLNAQQAADGANDLAELASGLDILQEAFSNYQDDVANGRDQSVALRDMCQVLSQAAGVWLQEFNRDCSRLRVGW